MQTLEIAGVIALAIFIVDSLFRIRLRKYRKPAGESTGERKR